MLVSLCILDRLAGTETYRGTQGGPKIGIVIYYYSFSIFTIRFQGFNSFCIRLYSTPRFIYKLSFHPVQAKCHNRSHSKLQCVHRCIIRVYTET